MDNHHLDELNVEHTREMKQKNVLELKDQLLVKLFSVKSYTLLDLCSIAETCERFQKIARRVFPKELCVRIRRKGDYDIRTRYELTTAHGTGIERIFKNFGPFLSGVSISIPRMDFSYDEYIKHNNEIAQAQERQQYEESNFVLGLLARFCADGDGLKVLKINGMKVPRFVAEELKPIFARLKVLKIRDAIVSDNDTLFAGCDSLVELRVVHVENCQAILANVFPKLELFGYGKPHKSHSTHWPINEPDSRSTNVVIDRLSTFILLHPGLKKIILANKMNAQFLSIFGENLDKLEELGLNMSGIDVESLHQLGALRSLKTLKLMHAACYDLTFVPALPKLREFYSYDCHLPDDRSFQCYFLMQLTGLHIMHGETPVPDVANLVRLLIHLKMLTIFDLGRFVLDEHTFGEIVDSVNGRPHRLTIKCKFDFDARNWNGNRNVRLLPVEPVPMQSNF